MNDIILDGQIRNYALLPIFLLTLLVGIIRQNLRPGYNTEELPKDLKLIKTSCEKVRLQSLKKNYPLLPEQSLLIRQKFFSTLNTQIDSENVGDAPSPIQSILNPDPAKLPTMLKAQLLSFVPQASVMYLITNLFSGFVVAKIPFLLTFRFKSMLQHGVDVPSLGVCYVSSLSWYFFCLVGLNGFLMFINFMLEKKPSFIQMKQWSPSDAPNLMPAMGMFAPGSMGGLKGMGNEPKSEPEIPNFSARNYALNGVEELLLKSWNERSRRIINL